MERRKNWKKITRIIKNSKKIEKKEKFKNRYKEN